MNKTDKIVIGAASVVALSAITMLTISKKCTEVANSVVSNLMNVRFTLAQTKDEIVKSNAKISDANRILRNIIKDDVNSENETKGKSRNEKV